MATVQFYSGTNMSKFDWLGWPQGGAFEPDDYRSNAIRLEDTLKGDDGADHDYEGVYGGSFSYQTFTDASGNVEFLGVSSGTITSFTLFEDEIIDAKFEDMSFDAEAAFNFIKLGDLKGQKFYNTELLSLILSGDDTITGSYFDDKLMGFGGNDTIYGGHRTDILRGGSGDDTLIGGRGLDTLTGGGGDDRFEFWARNEGGDLITGFTAADDTVAVLGSAFGGLTPGLLKGIQFQRGSEDTALTADVRFFYETDTGILRYDSNGSAAGGVTIVATLDGAPDFYRADLLIL